MKQHPSKLTILSQACKARRIIIERSRGRKDYGQMNHSLMFAEQFLINYPVADDARVTEWCRANFGHLWRILTPKTRKHFDTLMNLKTESNGNV